LRWKTPCWIARSAMGITFGFSRSIYNRDINCLVSEENQF
jgi:hypothetical protein